MSHLFHEYVEAKPKNLHLRVRIFDETRRKRAEKTGVIKLVTE